MFIIIYIFYILVFQIHCAKNLVRQNFLRNNEFYDRNPRFYGNTRFFDMP